MSILMNYMHDTATISSCGLFDFDLVFLLLPHACAFLERLPIIYKNIFLHIKVTRKCKDISQYR